MMITQVDGLDPDMNGCFGMPDSEDIELSVFDNGKFLKGVG